MNIEWVKTKDIIPNENNPRILKDDKFKKLVQSIKDFPEMLEIRPIVVNNEMMILGGNMRWKAIQEIGIKEIPIIKAENLTEEQQREFIIKDNVGFGEWDWEMITNEWDAEQVAEWGLDVPNFESDVDYSILEDDNELNSQLESMANGVKKAIQIEFEAEHYEEAYELVKFWREKGGYVGGMIMEFLKAEKESL